MNLRTILVWGMSAFVLAGCSGGTASVPSTGGATTGTALLQLDVGSLQSLARAPKYVGPAVDTVAYTFTSTLVATVAGSVNLSTCKAGSSAGAYTCTVSLPPSTYALALSVNKGTTVLGNASTSGIIVNPAQSTPVSLSIVPVLNQPSLTLPAGVQFYVDGKAQTIAAAVNELDPAGDIITTYYGPVSNYPTLTLTPAGGTTGVTVNGGTAKITTPPSAQTGGTVPIAYNGTGANTASVTLSVSDGTNSTSPLSIPFVSITPSVTALTLTGQVGGQTVTFTEGATSGGTANFDTGLLAATDCGAHVTFTPAVVGFGNGNTLINKVLTFNVSANDSAIATCTLQVVSPQDPNMISSIVFTMPAGLGVGVH